MKLTYREKPFESAQEGVVDGEAEAVSYWQRNLEVSVTGPLQEDRSYDVAVVGGGYTGLSTAHELGEQAPELDVALLERDWVGFGASGRNAGFVMPLLGWDLAEAVDDFGREEARRAYELTYDAVDHVRRLVEDHDLDCDKEETGFALLNTCRKRERHTRRVLELAEDLGFERRWVDGDELDDLVESDSFLSACYDPEPFLVDPGKLARQRKQLVEELGVDVYEATPATRIESGDGVEIETPEGSVSADAGVVAVNGYGEALGFRRRRFVPVHTFVTLTEPLSESQLDASGWGEGRTSFETARNFVHYFRLTEDDRLLFGGDDIQLYRNGGFRDDDPGIVSRLQERVREFFPQISDVDFTHSWGGVLAVTLDMYPEFGRADDSLYYAGGYSGHGVALSNYAGKLLAPRVAESVGVDVPRDVSRPFFVDREAPYIPPDPLRYVGLHLYRRWLDARDRWQGA